MKILLSFGTRPEAIKMCPIIKELTKYENIKKIVCITGQHREMLTPILDLFHIVADYNLDIMKDNQTLYDITSNILDKIRSILKVETPDIVLVHGDTTSAFAVALACFYMKIPVCHVEAGLRTYNKYSPYPEEFNRQAIDAMTDIYFAPTEETKENLLKEGKNSKNIYVTGNTVIDALKTTVRADYYNEMFEWIGDDRLILLTAHRRENLGTPMESMFEAIKTVLGKVGDIKVIYPVHLNPEVRKIANRVFANEDRVKIIEPLGVFDFHNFINRAYLIMTDSGGIQEEAPALGKPVLVMRDTTERPEGIKAGTLRLTGTKKEGIVQALTELLTDKNVYQKMAQAQNPYGDGKASERIVKILCERLGKTNVEKV